MVIDTVLSGRERYFIWLKEHITFFLINQQNESYFTFKCFFFFSKIKVLYFNSKVNDKSFGQAVWTHFSTNSTSNMLMRPKTAARRAGAVYMLSSRSIARMATPFSPMNERHAWRADIGRKAVKHQKNRLFSCWFCFLFLFSKAPCTDLRLTEFYLVQG